MFYTAIRRVLIVLSYIFFPIKIHGDPDDIPQDCGISLCANHISFFDVVFMIMTFKRQIRFVGKEKYINNFILKYPAKWIGAFGINPEKPDLVAIKNCFRVLKNKEVLGIFPEGTRIIGDKVSDAMPGAIMIAHKSKTDIFYVRIKPSRNVFKTFCKTDIYIGKTVSVSELGVTDGKGDEYKLAAEKLMKKIYELGEK